MMVLHEASVVKAKRTSVQREVSRSDLPGRHARIMVYNNTHRTEKYCKHAGAPPELYN